MSDPMPKIRALLKAQGALTRLELNAKSTQATYVALALVLGLLAFGMLNLAAFLALAEHVGQVWSGVILGVADALLAVALVKRAQGVTPGPAADTARELRDLVLHELSNDAEQVKGEILHVRDDIKRVTSGISRVGNVVPGLSSVVGLLKGALKKKK